MTISRRQLLGMLRGARATTTPEPDAHDTQDVQHPSDEGAPPETAGSLPDADANEVPAPSAGFSLDAFYAQRTADRTLPVFEVRATAATATTRVGVGRLAAVEPPAATEALVTPVPPGLVPAVLQHRCLATSSFCSVCVERCPIAGAIVIEHGRPRVEASRCDGCGRCVATCPAPILAFALVPRRPPENR